MDFHARMHDLRQKIKFIFFKYKIPLRIFAGLLIIILILVAIFAAMHFSQKATTAKTGATAFFKSAYVPDELVVELKNEYTKSELELIRKKFDELGVIGQQKAYEADKYYLNNFYILKFKSGTDLVSAKTTLDATGIIEASHPNYILTIQDSSCQTPTQNTPNDACFRDQWDMPKIGMPAAWNITHGSNNVIVAVIDSGIDFTHPDFAGRTILKGPNYANCQHRDSRTQFCLDQPTFDPIDDNGHGTHVAGTIGAVTNNGIGIAGMNWNVNLMAIKTAGANGRGTMIDNVNAIQYALANNVKVVNLSMTSGKGGVVKCTDPHMSDLKNTISDAVNHGITVVVAAGNENQDALNEIPPSCPGVITVGATDVKDLRWPGSNYGSDVTIAAPGVNIASTYKNGSYVLDSGTSMAAPHVAGAAALLLSQKPNMSPADIKKCLVSSGDPISTDKAIGGVRLNVAKALNNCTTQVSLVAISPQVQPTPTTSPLPSVVTVQAPSGNVPIYSSSNTAQQPIGQVNSQTTYTVVGQTNTMFNIQLSNTHTGWIPKADVITPTPTTVLVATGSQSTGSQAKTYTCRQANGFAPKGAIQIGNLICTPK